MNYLFSFPETADKRTLKKCIRELEALDGVKSVKADFRQNQLRVKCDEDTVSEDELLETVKLSCDEAELSPILPPAPQYRFRRFLSWTLALVSVYLSLALRLLLPLPDVLHYPLSAGIVQLLLALAVWSLCAWTLKGSAPVNAFGAPASYTFTALAALCAVLYSIPALIFASARVSAGEQADLKIFFDCAALLPAMMTLGQRVEKRRIQKLSARLPSSEGFGAEADMPRCVKRAYLLGRIMALLSLALALGSTVFWCLRGEALAFAVSCAVCVLSIACPGIPGLSASIVLMRSAALMADGGIRVADARVIEQLASARSILADEVNGLTDGSALCEGCVLTPGTSESTLLSLAASALQNREDSASLAIVARAHELSIPLDPIIEEEGEVGVRALIGETRVMVGDRAFMEKNALDMEAWDEQLDVLEQNGCFGIFVITQGQVKGIIALRSALRNGARKMIADLHRAGLETALLADSSGPVADALAVRVGTDKVIYPTDRELNLRLMAADKNHYLHICGKSSEALSEKELRLNLSGTEDGVARVHCTLEKVPYAILYARRALKNIKRHIWIYILVEAVCLPLAAGVLHGRIDIGLSPLLAALIMLALNCFMLLGREKKTN